MLAERLAQLDRFGVGFDTETHRIQPGLLAPPVVLGSLAIAAHAPGGMLSVRGELLDKPALRATFAQLLADPRLTLVMANAAFDMLVLAADAARIGADIMPQIFDLYDPTHGVLDGPIDGRVFDLLIAECLHAIAQGHLGIDPATSQKMRDNRGCPTDRYGLANVLLLTTGRADAKRNDRFREAFATFDDQPLASLPYEAQTYPVDDACNQLTAGLAQAGYLPSLWPHTWEGATCTTCGTSAGGPRMCWTKRPRRNLHELARQTYAAWAMHCGAAWGFVVDQDEVDRVLATYEAKHGRDLQPFVDAGLLRGGDGKKAGTEDQAALKRRVAWSYGAREACPTCNGSSKVLSPKSGKAINCDACGSTGLVLTPEVPRTETGGVKTDKDALEESGDDLLVEYEAHCNGAKIPTTYVPYLRHQYKDHDLRSDGQCARCNDPTAKRCQPANWRSLRLTLRPNVIVATGRSSYSDPAQQFPRGWGLRECIVAAIGRALSSIDYKAGELVTHAQNCLDLVGESNLARVLNDGLDPHLALAGTILGKPYSWVVEHKGDKLVKDVRQASKPPNFGFPGGMGPVTLVRTQRRQGPDTPHPSGPAWLDDGKGGKIRGYRGLRFCLLMGRAERCGEVMLLSYRDKPIGQTCKACIECAIEIRDHWRKTYPENVAYLKLANEWSEIGEVTQRWSQRVRGDIDYCVIGSTLVHTREGRVPAETLCGRTVDTLSEGGVYRTATWRSFGNQPTYVVKFSNGDEITTTREHRWKVVRPNGQAEWVTTASLVGRNVPMQGLATSERTLDVSSENFRSGVRHGLIFGDGHVDASQGKAAIRQYGDSIHLIDDYFDDRARHHKSLRYPETGTAFAGFYPPELKTTIPTVAAQGKEYALGFIAGYIGSDGSVSRNGDVCLHSAVRQDLVTVRALASDLGLVTTSISAGRLLNPWNGAHAPMFTLMFSKCGFDERLIIKNSHRVNWSSAVHSNRKTRIKVLSVTPTGRTEQVFCCEEPVTHTWVAGEGYLTGNCSGANGMFQGLLAEATKNAICQIQRECLDRTVRVTWGAYAGGPSPLLGSRMVVAQHDETINDHPIELLHEGATRASEIMELALGNLCPGMSSISPRSRRAPITDAKGRPQYAVEAKPAAMLRWYKGAEPVYDDAGRLVPWVPKAA